MVVTNRYYDSRTPTSGRADALASACNDLAVIAEAFRMPGASVAFLRAGLDRPLVPPDTEGVMRYDAWTATLLASFAALLMFLFLPKLGEARNGGAEPAPGVISQTSTSRPPAASPTWSL